MKTNYSPVKALEKGTWFKLICGASFQHLPEIRNLALIYSLAGADCIDMGADPAVIRAAQEGIEVAQSIQAGKTPWLMVSLNVGEDPHFRKALFNPLLCPSDCQRPCETICPAAAIALPVGISQERCYGCGRCLPICPSNLIYTKNYLSTPEKIIPLIETQQIQAIEIHTQVGQEQDFERLWQKIAPQKQIKLLAISFPDHPGLIPYLKHLYHLISPLPCPLIWQTDGRPMSGDIGSGTTHLAIKLAQKVLQANLPGYVQLAGGTNGYTVEKLRKTGLLGANGSPPFVAGVAYGSCARSLLAPIFEQLGHEPLEKYPALLHEALILANKLIHPIKTSETGICYDDPRK